ncbi:spindle-pole body protein [Aspergillus sclerotialis]|uniref:Spindle-pole body protein n=1 Tax=Aspergillus sclerotialis TaxID=2070753 RepID=A0A3A2ZMH1_9EURO|nr:spindle-pole body protein [Aspergillus sclerotialis]
MVVPYIDTPRTEVDGNATYLTNGLRSVGRTNLSALDSVENSFQTPSKDEDILNAGRRRNSSRFKLTTPRAGSGPKSMRSALNDRRQLPTAGSGKGEFTPLMQSVTRNNALKNMSTAKGADPKTPAYLRASYRSNANTPGLPPMDMTGIDEEEVTDNQPTPLPQVASSSAQSTPLPTLPGRNGGGVLSDGQNMMTLKEQEKIIDKLDKDNFGLKLKIHYLQEQIEKAGPTYNQAALKENTELKVLKCTLQRDISRYKKNLQQAERDLESYRVQFQELREKARRRQADEELQREMDLMREEIDTKSAQVRELQDELREAKEKKSEVVEKLRDEIEDLEASVREKDRVIEERDDAIEELKNKDSEEHDAVSGLEAELQHAREQLDELQESLDQAKSDANEARNATDRAIADKERAEEDLRELHDEMANKSFSTKGLTRQMEERASKLEEELRDLKQENSSLKEELEAKIQREAHLEKQYHAAQQEMEDEERRLQHELDMANHERSLIQKEHDKVSARLREVVDELQRRDEEKELLQTRHHALTDESGGLQNDLAKAHATIRELQQAVDDEKQHALDNGQNVRTQYKEEIDRLEETIDYLRREIEDKSRQYSRDQDKWESTKRTMQLQKDRAEEEAAGLRRTIEKLERAEHSLSGKEHKLQEVIDSEKSRHLNSEAALNRQIKELNDDLASKRRVIDEQRGELLSAKEELRTTKRQEESLKESVQALEDEVVVLQTSLEEEQQYAKTRLQKGESGQDANQQRLIADKQRLRDELANAHVELHDLRTSIADIEAERDELQSQLDRVQSEVRDTTRFDREKIELRKTTLRLENELKRLKEDKPSLLEEKEALEKQLASEIERATMEENRLLGEIDELQSKLRVSSSGRDRELSSAKSKVQRLERRISELESLLEQQPLAENDPSTANADVSFLRHSLDEARKREKTLRQREADQKSSVRTCKSRIAELEKELHEAMMKKYEVQSPQSSPSNKMQEEIRNLRRQLSETHKALRELKSKNRDLERAAMREEDQRELHDMLKSSTIEAETLALNVSERDARINELRTQMRRMREERAAFLKKAEAANRELESLQDRYNQAIEQISTKPDKTRHELEMLGLGKEIIWLRARLRREEKFRRDLAWSKGLMELGEQVRVACNEADLRMVAEMGVKPRDFSQTRTPRQKFRTAISLVRATVRMQRMSREWKKTKKLGEGLKRAKSEVLKRKESMSKKAVK